MSILFGFIEAKQALYDCVECGKSKRRGRQRENKSSKWPDNGNAGYAHSQVGNHKRRHWTLLLSRAWNHLLRKSPLPPITIEDENYPQSNFNIVCCFTKERDRKLIMILSVIFSPIFYRKNIL